MFAARAQRKVVHGHQHAALAGFQSVAHIRQRAVHDRAHRIGKVAVAKLLLDLLVGDLLVVEHHRRQRAGGRFAVGSRTTRRFRPAALGRTGAGFIVLAISFFVPIRVVLRHFFAPKRRAIAGRSYRKTRKIHRLEVTKAPGVPCPKTTVHDIGIIILFLPSKVQAELKESMK